MEKKKIKKLQEEIDILKCIIERNDDKIKTANYLNNEYKRLKNYAKEIMIQAQTLEEILNYEKIRSDKLEKENIGLKFENEKLYLFIYDFILRLEHMRDNGSKKYIKENLDLVIKYMNKEFKEYYKLKMSDNNEE